MLLDGAVLGALSQSALTWTLVRAEDGNKDIHAGPGREGEKGDPSSRNWQDWEKR